MTVKIAVFASGHGSNLKALLDKESEPRWPAKVVLVVTDKPGCYAVERAKAHGVSVFAERPSDYADKAAFEAQVVQACRRAEVEWLVLAGYMRLIGHTLLEAYAHRIVNVHPSLLPAFPGRQAVKDALAAGVNEVGVTIHRVDEGVDTGPILAQEAIPVSPGESETDVLERVHQVEHRLYPSVLERLWAGEYGDGGCWR